MPIVSIITQPTADALLVAYRPIVLEVRAQDTDLTPDAPVVYCDVYINGIYYRTISKTQWIAIIPAYSTWQFDLQDSLQEYLRKYISDNGLAAVDQNISIIASVLCRFRSSGHDANGFLVQEGTPPVQGSDGVDPTPGDGTESNVFYVLNSTLQHEQNQVLVTHLDAYKHRAWDADTQPLTHRPDHYHLDENDSDMFPIVTDKYPGNLILHYKVKGAAYASIALGLTCDPVAIDGTPTLPDATEASTYSYVINLLGSAPFTLSSVVKPGWMTITVVGNTIVFGGTPAPGDVGTDIDVSFDVKNCCDANTDSFSDTIDVIAGPNVISLEFGADNFDVCGKPFNNAYYAGTIGVGVILYHDGALTTPWSGYGVARTAAGLVYTLDGAGEITGTTVDVC